MPRSQVARLQVLLGEIEHSLERALARPGDTEDLTNAYVLATRASIRLRRAEDEESPLP